ncbi:hypothetical protein BC834DRAFT_50465 [Gloeopeniophorella convolvens]|nr:hypothetical protein BC834DRAFT_50465 [Gloeopeniophorella convolvens]
MQSPSQLASAVKPALTAKPRAPGPCAVRRVYKPRPLLSEILTTLAFWLRSSVVSVLNSLTTIMGAPPPLLVILFLQPLFPGLCLQPGRRDDLAAALLACVVGGSPLLFLCCSFYHLPFGGCLGPAKEYLGWSSGDTVSVCFLSCSFMYLVDRNMSIVLGFHAVMWLDTMLMWLVLGCSLMWVSPP